MRFEPPLLTPQPLLLKTKDPVMCHSLIGYKKAQSMCSPLIQSEPSLTISPSLHLSPPSLKPLGL